VLLVEDSTADANLVLAVLGRSARKNVVTRVSDGQRAMDVLAARPGARHPDLILLDLNLPQKDGWQVLAECKADGRLKTIPIVVFTTSASQDDVDRCYAMGANSYVTKPYDLDAFQNAVAMIDDFWLGLSMPWARD
jgi:CheY-like chemotaxis protein